MNRYGCRIRHAIAAATLYACSGAAFAQVCNTPTPYPSEPNPVSGTTCDGEPAGLWACFQTTNAPSHVYSLRVGTNATAEILLSSASAARLQLMLIGRNCNGDICEGVADSSGSAMSLADVPAGEYNLVVTAVPDEPDGTCGPFSILLTGNVGDFDLIFADGFD